MGQAGQIRKRVEKWIREEKPEIFEFKGSELFLMFKEWCDSKQIHKPTYVSFYNHLKDIKNEIAVKKHSSKNKTNDKKRSPKITLEEKETTIKVNLDLVTNGFSNGMIVSGPTGIGKTTDIVTRLKEFNFEYDYFSGAIANPLQFYKHLYHHRNNNLIVVDDTSGLIGKNDDCGNIISAALDDNDSKKNVVSYLHNDFKYPDEIEAMEDDNPAKKKAIPNRFEVTSGMIFLTNTEMSKISNAIASRCFPLDYWLTSDEIIWKIEKNLDGIYPDANMKMKKEVLKFFKDNKDVWNRFDIRSFKKACLYRFADCQLEQTGQWKRMTEAAINSLT